MNAEMITEKKYNYLIAVPCMRKHLLARREVNEFSFIGTLDEVKDMHSRLRYFDQ